jgi:hypothetical protein
MNLPSHILLAQTTARSYLEWTRLEQMSQWWHWMVFLTVCLALIVYVSLLYRRDSVELPRGTRWTLWLLRLAALVGLLIFFLSPEKKSERKVIKNSRVLALIDTSQSMGLTDRAADSKGMSRIEQVRQAVESSNLIPDLRSKHDLVVYRFDQTNSPEPIATFLKSQSPQPSGMAADPSDVQTGKTRESRQLWMWTFGFGALAVACLVWHLAGGAWSRGAEGEAWALLVSVVLAIVALVVLAVNNLRNPHVSWAAAFGQEPVAGTAQGPVDSPEPAQSSEPTVDWSAELVARGAETRLGEAIRAVIERERGTPLAGIVVISDGGLNSGIEHTAAADLARQAFIKLYPIGVGSDETPRNVRIVDLEAPSRVFPGDDFTVKAFVQADGVAEPSVKVTLVSRDASSGESQSLEVAEQETEIALLPAGQIAEHEFHVTPDAVGQRLYTVRLATLANEIDSNDNAMSTKVEIVLRKNRVLLIAGGPTREYQFVRNLMYRDKETTVDVLLQSGTDASAQEADQILQDLPETIAEIFEYDCMVAFDPDWRRFDARQIEFIDRWVAEKAGGMVLIAGPVFTGEWSREHSGDAKLEPIRSLYPVTFYGRVGSSIDFGRFTSEAAWPLQFTDEALRTDFLRLNDPAEEARNVWEDFSGVYSYFGVKGPKPGASVIASFSDPSSKIDDQLPPYMVSQFYGAGRVVYLGSGEMWRLREIDEKYFDRFYTKLIRYVSQGRLLRDSSRGVLLVNKERCTLGENIVVRASLSDEQFQPLKLDEVRASLLGPRGTREDLILRPVKESNREGIYTGQFTAIQEGDYQIELAIPGTVDELLRRDVRVRVPQREIEHPQRNDAVLSELASATDGTYYVGLDAALGRASQPALAEQLVSMDQETFLPGLLDEDFQQRLMTWLLAGICGALSLEWLMRRLSRLA